MLKLLLFLSIGCLAAAGEIYQWTDDNGRVHFGDRPLGEDSERLRIDTKAPVPRQSSAQTERERARKRQRLLEVYQSDRAEKRAEAEKAKRAKEQKQRKCQQARQRFARFNRSSGIYDTEKNGERRYLDEKQRSRYMKKLQVDIDRHCGK